MTSDLISAIAPLAHINDLSVPNDIPQSSLMHSLLRARRIEFSRCALNFIEFDANLLLQTTSNPITLHCQYDYDCIKFMINTVEMKY